MIKNYTLSKNQHYCFWNRTIGTKSISSVERMNYWNEHVYPLYHISYYENDANDNQYNGMISGDDNHVNLFILKNL